MNQVQRTCRFSGHRLELVHGDITRETVDAIVNAANAQLMHGGGVAAAISRKGGPVIDRESRAWVVEHGPISHDRPAWTSGGNLPARFVIHAVGPVWGSGDEDAHLTAAVLGSLRLAASLNLASISLPAVSTGIFGFPRRRAAALIFQTIREFLENEAGSVDDVRLVLYDEHSLADFTEVFDEQFPQ